MCLNLERYQEGYSRVWEPTWYKKSRQNYSYQKEHICQRQVILSITFLFCAEWTHPLWISLVQNAASHNCTLHMVWLSVDRNARESGWDRVKVMMFLRIEPHWCAYQLIPHGWCSERNNKTDKRTGVSAEIHNHHILIVSNGAWISLKWCSAPTCAGSYADSEIVRLKESIVCFCDKVKQLNICIQVNHSLSGGYWCCLIDLVAHWHSDGVKFWFNGWNTEIKKCRKNTFNGWNV